MYVSWKFKVRCAFIVMMASLAAMVVGCTAEPGVRHLVVQEVASATVNRMAEIQLLNQQEVYQVSVVCVQKDPNGPFRVAAGYWPKKRGPQTVYTDIPCNSWSQVMGILPARNSGWQVLAASADEAKAAPYYVHAVAQALRQRNS